MKPNIILITVDQMRRGGGGASCGGSAIRSHSSTLWKPHRQSGKKIV